MYDEELDASAPYDNVEFPVRKPGTGTWPGPATASGAGVAGVRLYGHQTTGRQLGMGSKLAPLVEVEGSECGENNRLQTISFGDTTSSTQAAIQQQNQQTQNKANLTTTAQQQKATIQQSTAKGDSPSMLSLSATTTSTSAAITATPPSTQQAVKQTQDKNSKPVITMSNDSSTYMSSQVTSADSSRKKALKLPDAEEDFKRQDLNPGARLALERVYTKHADFYQLNNKILDEGSLLKQDILEIYRRTGEAMTYEQLLQGMLVDGERFLLGSCWLYYTHVQFLDVEGTRSLREPYGRGRIGLTNKRVLFLSTETYTDANLELFEKTNPPAKKEEFSQGYKLEVSKRNSITFKNIPINNFHSADMEVITGTAAQTKIIKKRSCCSCLGIADKWVSSPPMTRSINSRVVRVGVSMPPWQTRMFLDIHLDPSMSLTVARDFITQLHTFAPHMH